MLKPDSSFPIFIVENLIAAKDFYLDNFNFSVAFENEWYLHLVSEAGIQVGFMLPNQPTQPEIFKPAFNGSGVIFSFEVSDAESAYAMAREKSLDVVLDLREEDWGQFHFCLKDPNGVYLDVVQAIEPSEEYKQGYTTE
jgi:uncharacterized glyoxalase superfamily protein PhnB